jgi:hypothetical protein
MLSPFYILHKLLQDTLGILSLSQSLLAVAWQRLPTADVPIPLGSWTASGLSYQLITATAHNNWTPAVIWLTPNLSCLWQLGMDSVENTVPLLQCNCCWAMALLIPLLCARPSALTAHKTPFLCCFRPLPSNDQLLWLHNSSVERIYYSAPSLTLLVPSSLQAYRHFFFSEVTLVTSVIGLAFLPVARLSRLSCYLQRGVRHMWRICLSVLLVCELASPKFFFRMILQALASPHAISCHPKSWFPNWHFQWQYWSYETFSNITEYTYIKRNF